MITTAAELDALPDDVLIRASGRYVANGGFDECWVRPIPESITGTGDRRLWQVLVFGDDMALTTADRMTYPVEVLYAPDEPVASTLDRTTVADLVEEWLATHCTDPVRCRCPSTPAIYDLVDAVLALLPATVKPDREALARALFESIDVEALAHVLAVHAYATNHRGFDQDCKCGAGRGTRRTLERGTEWHRRHQAEAVKAYLLGGTRIAREGGRTDG